MGPTHSWEGARTSCDDPQRSGEEEKPASLISLRAKRFAAGARAGSQKGAQEQINKSKPANRRSGASRLPGADRGLVGEGPEAGRKGREDGSTNRASPALAPSPAYSG